MSIGYGGLTIPTTGDTITASSVSTNFQKVLNNQAGGTAPASPVTGQEWYDTGTSSLKLWNGAAWVNSSGNSGYSGFSGATGTSGYSGSSTGTSGYSGFSGATGTSGYSGSSTGTSGYSGFSGSVSTSTYGYNVTVGYTVSIPSSGTWVTPTWSVALAPDPTVANRYWVGYGTAGSTTLYWRNASGVWAASGSSSYIDTGGSQITQLAQYNAPCVSIGCVGIGVP